MSLSDKYNTLIEQDQKNKEDREAILAKLKVFEDCGLGSVQALSYKWGRNEMFQLSDEASALVMEATALIKADKWHKAKIEFTADDAEYCNGRDDKMLTKFYDPSYVKVKWPDGYVHLCQFEPEIRSSKLGWFVADIWAKRDTPHFLREINQKHSQVEPWLSGKQRYVVLVFNYKVDYSNFSEKVLLFEDGSLFIPNSDITINDKTITYKYDDNYYLLETVLLENIKRINGE